MNQHHQAQWADVIVKRTIGWEDGQDNMAILLVPRFRKGPLAKWLQPRLKRPFMRVKLDEIGSFVWKSCDGNKNFKVVAQAMEERFGSKVIPVEERLKQFLITLKKDKFIELFTPDPNA